MPCNSPLSLSWAEQMSQLLPRALENKGEVVMNVLNTAIVKYDLERKVL